MQTTLAIIQARLGSTRLPRKVLADFCGQTLLARVVDRVRMANGIDEVIVATSVAPGDDEIASHCDDIGVPCFRGSENDVLGRFIDASEQYDADWIVRVNADNPFLASEYLEQLLDTCRIPAVDYASYRVGKKPAMLTACGLFAEIVSRTCLERAAATIVDPHLREHVTLGIYQSPDAFRVRFLDAPAFAADPRLRLTLDTADDLELLRIVAKATDQQSPRETGPLDAKTLCDQIFSHELWLKEMHRLNLNQPK